MSDCKLNLEAVFWVVIGPVAKIAFPSAISWWVALAIPATLIIAAVLFTTYLIVREAR